MHAGLADAQTVCSGWGARHPCHVTARCRAVQTSAPQLHAALQQQCPAHRVHLKVADVLGATLRAALSEAVAVQLRQLAAGHTRAHVQAVHVLAADVLQLA
jgi:hypothetical protein